MRFRPFQTSGRELERLGPPDVSPPSLERFGARVVRALGPSAVAASEEEIDAAEDALGVRFPSGYRAFLRAAGGASVARAWRGLWRLPELVSLNRSLPVFRWFGGLVGVGNEGFIVYALDFRRGDEPPLVAVGASSSSEEDVAPLAPSFEAWLASTLPAA